MSIIADLDVGHAEEQDNSEIPMGIPMGVMVKRTNPGAGARISTVVKEEVSEETDETERLRGSKPQISVKEEVPDSRESLTLVKQEPSDVPESRELVPIRVKAEPIEELEEAESLSLVPSQVPESQEGLVLNVEPITTLVMLEASEESGETEKLHRAKHESPLKKEERQIRQEENVKKIRSVLGLGPEIRDLDILLVLARCGDKPEAAINCILENPISWRKGPEPKSQVKKEAPDCQVISVQQTRPENLEDADFPVEQDWLMVGRTFITALSTSKGRKLVDNEIVHFTFPCANSSYKTQWIVRFSTKRFGEVYQCSLLIASLCSV